MSEYALYANPIWCSLGAHSIDRYPGVPIHRLMHERAWACDDCFKRVKGQETIRTRKRRRR